MLICFTELYKKLYFFNHNIEILNYIMEFALSRKYKTQQVFCKFVKFIFQESNPNLYKTKL